MKVLLYKNNVYCDTWYVDENETVLDVIKEAIQKGYSSFEIDELKEDYNV